MNRQRSDLGMIGLGVMGRNFMMNVADHGFSVAGYDRDPEKGKELDASKNPDQDIRVGYGMGEFIGLLKRPRVTMMLVPAGNAVDAVIEELLKHLEPGDLIIDSGNSHFRDTERRAEAVAAKGVLFMGMGMSGGESGARNGPSLMPGGPMDAYERVRPMLEAAAAHVDREPCVTYLGSGSSGHYVKMVHNGIEYGIMQLIAETYDLMKRGLGRSNADLMEIYERWDRTELSCYLLEITSRIFGKMDEKSGKPLIDLILDSARQKGTGEWTSSDALELQMSTPTIDMAVVARDMSAFKSERETAAAVLHGPEQRFQGDPEHFVGQLRNALYASMILTYAQGMALLGKASRFHGYGLNLEAVARIWRGGCIIRAALLEDIRAAYKARPELSNLLLDPGLSRAVTSRQTDLRAAIAAAIGLGLPVPGFTASLAYFDMYRSSWLPANLIQAQRDFFGAHTYERLDLDGTFHTRWEEH